MNKKLVVGLLALVGGVLLIIGFTRKKLKLKRNAKLLFVGDSYTAGNSSYADQLKSRMPDLQIKKIAKVGETTEWMVNNTGGDLSNKSYDAVFILGGLNDVYAKGDISVTEKNLQSMYESAIRSGIKVVGVTIAPTDFYPPYTEKKGKLTDDLNGWISSNKSLDAVFDFNSMLKKGGKQDLELFTTDKLHALPKAHKMLADTIEKQLFE